MCFFLVEMKKECKKIKDETDSKTLFFVRNETLKSPFLMPFCPIGHMMIARRGGEV